MRPYGDIFHEPKFGNIPAALTVVTTTIPACLSKGYYINDGGLQKRKGGVLVKGHAKVFNLTCLDDLKTILTALRPQQALIYGVPKGTKETKLMSSDQWVKAGKPSDAIPRTKEHFEWPAGPGIMMIDYDPGLDGGVLSRDELVRIICEAAPGLNSTRMLWNPSASSHITNMETGEDLTGLKGQRLYILVNDARDIPRAGQALVEALWAYGHGRIEISKAGSLLERTTVDSSVWQGNRLDFAAGASCEAPLQQCRGEPIIIPGEVEVVDTRVVIPDLNDKQKKRADECKAQARSDAGGQAKKVREAWKDEQVELYAGPNAEEQLRHEIRANLEKALEHRVLNAGIKIIVVGDQGDELVSVGTILDNPELYEGMQTKDPLEPDYQNGKTVGKLYLTGSQPTLHSFAHGSRTFKLRKNIPRVEVVTGQTHDCVEKTLVHMRKDPELYDLGGTLVKVDAGKVYPLDEPHLTHELGGGTQFWRYKKKTNGDQYEVLLDPPPRVVKPIIAMGKRRNLKPLDAVVTAPTLGSGGSIIDKPGYDQQSRLLLDVQSSLRPIPLSPTIDQVHRALVMLMYPFKDFPLATDLDRGVLLTALLTSVSRPALKTAPAFGIDAPVQASGKTLLALSIGALGTGETPAIWPHTSGRDDEEMRKRIITALRTNGRVIILDNLVGQFDSAAMAGILTSGEVKDRILGKSETVSIPNRALIIFTGNNLTLAGDMVRRVLTIRIDPMTDKPYARSFDIDPVAYVLKHRQEMVRAALTIIRGYLSSGSGRAVGRMASFELWDDYVRQTVAWVSREFPNDGYVDPMDAVVSAQVSDPEQETLSALLAAWQDIFTNQYFSAKEVLTELNSAFDQTLLAAKATAREALEELNNGRPVNSAQTLGRVIGYRKERIVNGRRLESKFDTSTNQKTWRVVNVT